MKVHPFADKFPPIDGPQWESFKESINATKGNEQPIEFRMVKGKPELLDGRNRLRACEELKLKPKMRHVAVKDDKVKAFIIRRNINRRHLTPELRQELVADLREDGQSTRQIAETLGVSHPTVMRDLDATGTNVPVVTGADGKERAASTKPKLLCASCQRKTRTGQSLHDRCRECAELRKATKKDKGNNPDADVPEDAPKGPPMDDLGNELPKKLRDAFAGNRQTIETTIKLLQEAKRMLKGLAAWNPFILANGTAKLISDAIENMKNGLPYAVCHTCGAKGCDVCRKSGWVTKWKMKDMMP